jgi:hypothetical protein
MAWTVREAQDRADRYGYSGCQPEWSIRRAAASIAHDVHQRTFMPGDAIEEFRVVPFDRVRSTVEVRVALPPSCGDVLALQLVIEDQLREHFAAEGES